jgi:uncharacterized protein
VLPTTLWHKGKAALVLRSRASSGQCFTFRFSLVLMFERFISLLIRFRWLIVAALVVATAAAGLHASSIRFDFSPRSLFLTADDEVRFLQEHRKQFGDEDALVMLLIEADDVFAREVLELVATLSDRFEEIEHIERVYSLATVQELGGSSGFLEVKPLLEELPSSPAEQQLLRERTLSNSLFINRFVNPSGKATSLLAKFEDGFVEELDRRPALAEMEEILASLQVEGVEATLVGLPVVNREYAVLLAEDMARTIVASLVLMCLLLFVLFRTGSGVLLPVASVVMAVAWTVAYMVSAGDYFNIINSIVPTLLLVIGVGDAVHFLTAYYQGLGSGLSKKDALLGMVRRVGMACLVTSITAAVGFASLVVARIDIIKGMGRVASVGLMISYFIILLLVPAVLAIMPSPSRENLQAPSEGRLGPFLEWLGAFCIRRKVGILLATLALCVFSAVGAMKVETDSFLLEELFDSNPVSKAMKHTEATITGLMPTEVSIHTAEPGGALEPEVLRGIEALQEHMARDPFVGHSGSVADLIKEIAFVIEGERKLPDSRRKVMEYLTLFEMSEDPSFIDSVLDGSRQTARISASMRDWGTKNYFSWYDGSEACDERALRCTDPNAQPMLELVDSIFGTTAGVGDGIEVRVTGGSLVAARALSHVVDDMMSSLLTAFFVIGLLMMVLLRSLRTGLLAMLPNVIPLLVTLGFMGWVGIPLRTSTALIFSVSLGVAVHDTIHFLTRYREELLRTRDREQALRLTMLSTGRAIIFTSVLLVGGFIIMTTTRFVGIFQMGVLGAITLFAALLGALLLLPVCLLLFRPWSRFVEKLNAPTR